MGEPIGDDELEIGKEPAETIIYQSLKPLKIPVSPDLSGF